MRQAVDLHAGSRCLAKALTPQAELSGAQTPRPLVCGFRQANTAAGRCLLDALYAEAGCLQVMAARDSSRQPQTDVLATWRQLP